MATKPIPHLSAEAIDEACITIDRAVEAATDGDNYWLGRVRNAFAKAGLAVHRLEREQHHPVWIVWLNVGPGDLPADRKLASKQLRKALGEAGLKIRPDELTVLEQRRGRVKAAFLFGTQLPAIDLMGI
ncbi:MAG: hypothetical protein ABSG59_22825 [Verrucomicrobiota bacterium]|jgi:hypothetical protein